MVNQLFGQMGFQSPRSNRSSGLLGTGNPGDNTGQRGRGGLYTPQVGSPQVISPQQGQVRFGTGGDSTDLSYSAQLLNALGLGNANSTPATSDTNADGSSSQVDPSLRLTEQFVRQRAIMTYSMPARTPYGPSMSLTFDVEVAYRQIDVTQPGQSVDVKA